MKMKINLHFFRNVFLIVSCFLISSLTIAQGIDSHTIPGVVRVKISPEAAGSAQSVKTSLKNGVVTIGVSAFDNVSRTLSVVKMKRVFPYSAKHDAKHRKHDLHLWYELSYSEGVSPLEAAANYKSIPDVTIAEPIYEKQLIAGSEVNLPLPAYLSSNAVEMPFDDTYLSDQWHYNNTGENATEAIVGADVSLFKAWEIETGKSNVIVSIVDGGFQTNHRDLAANVWVNEAELNGEEGVDDDGNGYVDDIHGYNFVRSSGEIEQHYHGTHVAGTVAAVNNNGLGVAGVAGGSGNGDGVRIQSAQIFNDQSSSTNIAAAIVYGADNGAVISQNSWGFTSPDNYEQVILDAIDYFVDEAGDYVGSPMKGGVVIFAAGNQAEEGNYYPGYYDSTIAVGAIKADNQIASYSNWGEYIDLASYGGDINVAQNAAVLSTYPNHEYAYLDGTSMACPHVSGIAALVVSKYGGSDFTNEQLKRHLLTGVRDVDSYNPDYIGKLGVGILDAELALANDEGIAPNAVQDIAILGLGQDFAEIQWTVPADTDDDKPYSFELLYHTETITNGNVLETIRLEIKNLMEAGEVYNYTINNLDATTTYYVAVRSIDRWGNLSELSNIASGTTNEGPDINTDVTDLSISADASESAIGTGSFTIMNEDVGVLEWESMVRHTNSRLAYNSTISYPQAKSGATGQIQSLKLFDIKRPKLLPAQGADNAIAPMANHNEYAYTYGFNPIVIGETDTTFTNSSATRYHVSEEEGFNLTMVEMMLKHKPATGPVIMEIYEGEKLDKQNIIAVYEVDSYKADPYWHGVYLDEQLYFEQGSTFWIVFHAPSGNLYPLGMDREISDEYSDNCFMSLDMGLTWMPLSQAIADDRYVWTTVAVSQNKHLGHYMTLTPSNGKVLGGETQEVDVEVDGTYLINGSYNSNILIKSNDKDEKEYRIPVSFEITGHKAELKHDKVIEFGTVFHGLSKELTFTVENTGYGNFYRLTPSSSDPQFEILKNTRSISARSTGDFTILYTPDGAGNDNSSLLLTDYYGNTHTINLFGVGVEPASMEVGPKTQDLGTLAIGDNATASINIANNGEYPLEFALPAFATDIDIEGIGNTHQYGYTYESNVDGDMSATYYWNDITGNGESLTDYFTQPFNKYYEVDLGFEFPFYGMGVESFFITRSGVLAMDDHSPVANCAPPKADNGCSPAGYISAANMEFDLNKGGSMHYRRESGKFILQYTDVVLERAYSNLDKVTFQIVLHYNGDVEYIFKDMMNMSSYDRRYLQVGVGDINYADPFLINGRYDYDNTVQVSIINETILRLKSPGQKLVKAVSMDKGFVNPGESVDIELSINTDGLYEANMFQKLAVISNDPFNMVDAFEVTANIIGGTPDVALLTENVTLGSVYQGGVLKGIAAIKNDGTKDVDITSVSLANDLFVVSGEVPYTLKAKSAYFVELNLKTENKGQFTDVLTFETSEGLTYDVNLSGEVTAAPGIMVDTTPIVKMLNAGEKSNHTISVENDGEIELDFLTNGADWMYVNDITAMNHVVKEFTYAAIDSREEGGPIFVWEDIVEGDATANATWFIDNDPFWFPLELPYEFEFWGETTDKIWISWQGVITTKEPEYSPQWLFPSPLPFEGEFNSIIAPLFTPNQESMFPDTEGYEEVGIFHKFYDDRIVITWSKFVDMFYMGSPYSFQAILYKNGNIKFQYSTGRTSFLNNAVIGLENHEGTEAVQMAAYQAFAEDRLAVSFVPTTKTVVGVGEKVNVEMVLDATYLNKGEYNTNFTIESNAPQEEMTMVPVTLTVEGEANLNIVDEINFGDVIAYSVDGDFGPEPVVYSQEFDVTNNGHDVLMFNMIALKDGTSAKTLIKQVDPLWGFTTWSELSPWNIPTLYPGDKAELRIDLAPEMLVHEIKDTLVFMSNLASGDHKLPIYANVNLPAALEYSNDTISYLANTRESNGSKMLTISNENGLSVMNYDVSFIFRRAGADSDESVMTASEPYQANTALGAELQLVESESTAAVEVHSTEFNNVLEYDERDVVDSSVGFGEGSALTSGITFKAPVEGFNLTHIKTWYRYSPKLESQIHVEVRAGGENVAEAQVLTSQTFDINLNAADTATIGGMFTLELENNQLFYPGEEFYITLAYDEDIPFPQGLYKNQETVKGRYFIKMEGAWYDLQANSNFTNTGWAIKACEETALASGWAELDGELSGTVPVGETKDLTINFMPQSAMEADNNGELVLSTNDPMNPMGMVPLYLRINQGPEYAAEGGNHHTVNENETLEVVINTHDLEGDDCTFALAEEYSAVNLANTDGILTLSYSPDYEAAGSHVFTINGEDAHGNKSMLSLNVDVVNVNRVPELYNTIENTEIVLEYGIKEMDLLSHFKDADMDQLTFAASGTGENILDIFISDERMMLDPLTIGTSSVTVVATDMLNASVSHTFDVTVLNRTGLEELEGARISTYPNPVVDVLTIEWDYSVLSEVTFRLVNVAGDVVRVEENENAVGKHQMQVDDLANGVYLLEMISEDEKIVKKIVIQN